MAEVLLDLVVFHHFRSSGAKIKVRFDEQRSVGVRLLKKDEKAA